VRSKYDLLTYFAFLTLGLGLGNYCLMVILISYLKLYTVRRVEHSKDERVMVMIMLFAVICVFLYMLVADNYGPTYNPFWTAVGMGT
jgi:hypothetical protein